LTVEADVICWADLSAKDMRAAASWYGTLLGWSAVDIDVGPEGGALLLELDGKRVVSMSQASSHAAAPVPPSSWVSYVAVASAEESTRTALAAGATVLVPPFDVMDLGREVILRDPVGALISLWEPRAHRGADLRGVPGSMCSHELVTSDVERAAAFYRALAGWEIVVANSGGETRATIRFAGRCIGGISCPDDGLASIGTTWLVGLGVRDCGAAVRVVKELRGEVSRPCGAYPLGGVWAWVRDDMGAAFALVQPGQDS
jgi:predicted enzyme related to lactoylglutathione lyase